MVDLQQPVWRVLTVTLSLFALYFRVLSPLPAMAAQDNTVLDGRLGGSFASFVSAYGKPVELNQAIGEVFAVEGFGLVAAQFSRLAGPSDDEAPALLITLRSERDETAPATTLDERDWTVEEARERALSFAPVDAELGDFTEASDGSLIASCASPALANAFGQLGESDCTVRAVQSAPGRVSFITLSLAAAAALDSTTPVASCDGVETWIQDAGGRMQRAQELLEQLASSETPDDAALQTIEEEFTALAAEQRDSAAPAEGATVNFYLIAAFSTFAGAVADARVALTAGDQAGIDRAAQRIAEANGKIALASAAITKLSADCRLSSATPQAG